MYISEDTLDDILNNTFNELLQEPFDVKATRGTSSEIIGALLHLKNPRARLSRTETKGTIFSALGELLWYLSKTNDLDFIKYYIRDYEKDSEDGKTIFGGYGPRLFNFRNKYNQVSNVINLLKQRPSSRKAVIQIFDAEDINTYHKEIPCTCSLQFLIRHNKLHMFISMRSNDAYLGLPHDIFAFTMLQEIIARSLDVEIGEYKHAVGSLHLYESDKENAKQYMEEGVQTTKILMPEMPTGDPWKAIHTILEIEPTIRANPFIDINTLNLNSYWKDLLCLLKIFSLIKKKNLDAIKQIQQDLTSPIYNTYINKRLDFFQKEKKI